MLHLNLNYKNCFYVTNQLFLCALLQDEAEKSSDDIEEDVGRVSKR